MSRIVIQKSRARANATARSLAKGGNALLYVDGKKVGEGRVE